MKPPIIPADVFTLQKDVLSPAGSISRSFEDVVFSLCIVDATVKGGRLMRRNSNKGNFHIALMTLGVYFSKCIKQFYKLVIAPAIVNKGGTAKVEIVDVKRA